MIDPKRLPRVSCGQHNLDLEPGDPVEIREVPYYFERVDSDGAFTFRPPVGSRTGDFMVIGEDGHPRKPDANDIAQLMRDSDIVFRSKVLQNEVRRYARAQGLDVKQAREWDATSPFRVAICRRWDAQPCSKSDVHLRKFMKEAMADPAIAELKGAWHASPGAVRVWLRDRGEPGCRKAADGISMTGRLSHLTKIGHPLEIALFWAVRSNNVRGDVLKNYDRYSADLTKINMGEPLNRNLFIDPSGQEPPCEKSAAYPIPAKPYKAMSYKQFWRLHRALASARGFRAKTSAKGEYHRYGGGGLSDLPTHLGALCWIDDSPVDKVFFVDGRTGIPIGLATITLMLEQKHRVVPGWDLTPGAPSSSSVMRTVLHANMPKDVPEDLLAIDPNLTWLRLRPDRIGFDNLVAHHGRSVEDALAEAYIGTRFVGKEMPRDKSHMERIVGTFLDLVFKHQEDANYDIARMRLYGFDPEKHVLCSIQSARRLLARAVMTYNVTRHRGLDMRQPALSWKQELGQRALNVLKDEDRFRAAIGIVEFEITMTNAGIEKFNRRYTPGAVAMKRILQEFERGLRRRAGDTSPRPKANRDSRKRLKFKVKVKYDADDIGLLRVWNPYRDDPDWEIFTCTDPDAQGTPLWLHERCLELAAREAYDYLTPEGQAYVRAKLFEEIANVDAQAAERERLTLARAASDPQVRKVLGQYVEVVDEVVDEVVEQFGEPEPETTTVVRMTMATGKRFDAEVKTPRSRDKPAKEPATMSRKPFPEAPAVERDPRRHTKGPARRGAGRQQNDDRRNPAAPKKSADRPDRQARSARQKLKWSDL